MFFEQDFNPSQTAVLSVSELNDRVSQCLQVNFPPLWVAGEVRGFTRAASGHWYFTLKDAGGELSCAMFAGSNRRVGFVPKTGDHLEVHGQVSIYRARGSYQMVVDGMRQAGLGALYEQFLRLKEKLQNEGLFDSSRKKPLDRIYTNIAVVTSLQAAALRDVLTTLKRRAPYAKVCVYEASVQGEEAPGEIISALRRADESEETQVIMLVRGGGSLQDLWAFNDEKVARTIASLTKPIVVGVGHESDVTIADWVADFRAATPTAAAEHVTENIQVLSQELVQAVGEMRYAWNRLWMEHSQRLDSLVREMPDPIQNLKRSAERLELFKRALETQMHAHWQLKAQAVWHLRSSLICPTAKLAAERDRLERTEAQLPLLMWQNLSRCEEQRQSIMDLITELSPEAILKKGYSYVTASDGTFVKSTRDVKEGDVLDIHWHDGQAQVAVQKR